MGAMSSRAHRIQEELEAHRETARLGNLLAIPAAMVMCADEKLVPPEWLVRASASLHCMMLMHKMPRVRGRSSNLLARRHQNNIDTVRHEHVLEIRAARIQLDESIEHLRSATGVKAKQALKERERMRKWLGRGNRRAFVCASLELRGTPARGSARAIRKSYEKVERHLKSGKETGEYRGLYHRFEMLTGTHVDGIGPLNPTIYVS